MRRHQVFMCRLKDRDRKSRKVCCHPIEISYSVQDDALPNFDAKILE